MSGIEKTEGPTQRIDGRLVCHGCKFYGLNDYHYEYCAAQPSPYPNKTYPYPWPGAGTQMHRHMQGCPYVADRWEEAKQHAQATGAKP